MRIIRITPTMSREAKGGMYNIPEEVIAQVKAIYLEYFDKSPLKGKTIGSPGEVSKALPNGKPGSISLKDGRDARQWVIQLGLKEMKVDPEWNPTGNGQINDAIRQAFSNIYLRISFVSREALSLAWAALRPVIKGGAKLPIININVGEGDTLENVIARIDSNITHEFQHLADATVNELYPSNRLWKDKSDNQIRQEMNIQPDETLSPGTARKNMFDFTKYLSSPVEQRAWAMGFAKKVFLDFKSQVSWELHSKQDYGHGMEAIRLLRSGRHASIVRSKRKIWESIKELDFGPNRKDIYQAALADFDRLAEAFIQSLSTGGTPALKDISKIVLPSTIPELVRIMRDPKALAQQYGDKLPQPPTRNQIENLRTTIFFSILRIFADASFEKQQKSHRLLYKLLYGKEPY